jgi:hypothetical protein
MTKNYELTYSDTDVPTHYAFKVKLNTWSIDELLNMSESTRLRQLANFRERYRNRSLPTVNDRLVTEVVRTLDERGAWVTEGSLKSAPGEQLMRIIDNQVFVRNIDILLAALQAKNSK